MLIIWSPDRNDLEIEWHVGDPKPPIPGPGRVVCFRADGDELKILLFAITAVSVGRQAPKPEQSPMDRHDEGCSKQNG